MLQPDEASRYARQLLLARAASESLPCLSAKGGLSAEDGYRIAQKVLDLRTAQGEKPIGRKIGFTNRNIWPIYGVFDPIWAHVYDTTVRYARDNHGIQSLEGAVRPRIEPEIVFKLGRAPDPDATIASIADCIEWMAHGFEIVVCPFADWKFEAADTIAAFGLHGTLIIGEPKLLSEASRRNLAAVLANACVSLSCATAESTALRAAGFGSSVLGSPVHALLHLHRMLQKQSQFAPLAAGEVIATGTLTDALPVESGQTWTTAFNGITLPGLTVSFV